MKKRANVIGSVEYYEKLREQIAALKYIIASKERELEKAPIFLRRNLRAVNGGRAKKK